MDMHVRMYSHRYMVDAADHEKLDASKNELHSLLEKPQLAGIPVSQTWWGVQIPEIVAYTKTECEAPNTSNVAGSTVS